MIVYKAQCLGKDCPSRPSFHGPEGRLQRSQWVGEHRVRTGHSVKMWEDEE